MAEVSGRAAANANAANPAGAGSVDQPLVRPLPAFYYRLSPRDQRCYLQSDSIDRYPLMPSAAAFNLTSSLMTALAGGAPSIVQRAAQSLVTELCRLLAVRPVAVEVRSVRPRNSYGELHGIFYPRGTGNATPTRAASDPVIILWMRTAQRHDVVKPKTFLRTLMHELGHYLDYAHLRLSDSYHTGGFFKRESFLVRLLTSGDPLTPALL